MADLFTLGGLVLPVLGLVAVLCALSHRAGQRKGYTAGQKDGRAQGIRAVLDGMAARTPGLRDDVARALAAGQDPTEIPTDRGDH